MRVLLLASGGVDSTTCWWLLRARGWSVRPLFIDFGQPAGVHEWTAVTALASVIETTPVRIHVSSDLYSQYPSYGLLPGRNLMLLALALAYAGARGISAVALGSNADDAQRGDGSGAFRDQLQRAANATAPRVRIIAPLAALSKPEVVRRARSLTAPLQATVSCYDAVAGGCGVCRGCFDRRRALRTD